MSMIQLMKVGNAGEGPRPVMVNPAHIVSVSPRYQPRPNLASQAGGLTPSYNGAVVQVASGEHYNVTENFETIVKLMGDAKVAPPTVEPSQPYQVLTQYGPQVPNTQSTPETVEVPSYFEATRQRQEEEDEKAAGRITPEQAAGLNESLNEAWDQGQQEINEETSDPSADPVEEATSAPAAPVKKAAAKKAAPKSAEA